jgi:hypothetical protein
MTTLKGDVVNRVRRLPKPTQASEALQPLFEAVSNALHAVEDAYGDQYQTRGRIIVTFNNLKSPDSLNIMIADNGIGFDARRYDAFCTTDTDHKISRGGKGIGRLLWLDAFNAVSIDSIFVEDRDLRRRRFSFVLSQSEQITGETVDNVSSEGTGTGTTITLRGLRGTAYRSKFPIQPATLIKHFGSHFFADFILGKAPQITVHIDDNDAVDFPDAITVFRVEDRGTQSVETTEFGPLSLASFICNKAASANFDGLHQMHLVANGRTVVTRKIDGLVGIARFGEGDDLIYHGCITGEFLDERVNQERTQFNFDESIIDQIVKQCANYARDTVLQDEIAAYDGERLLTMKDFVTEYPSFGFEGPEELLARTPKNAVKPEQFAQALIPIRIRRDKERNDKVKQIVGALAKASPVPEDFAEAVRKAADDVRAEEQRQLTEYVLRRKMVLDVLEVLIRRVRQRNDADDDYQLESTLHQFICPMRLRGDDPDKIERSDHDLWVIDERLTFTKYFASDVPFDKLIEESKSKERMDVFIFDRLHGLGLDSDEPLQRVMLVEFKKPGRRDYDERYSPLNQISRYITELKTDMTEDYKRERIRVADDCVFYCYVVADIVGNLEMHTSSWRTTSNGRGRIYDLSGKHRGMIEIIEWKDLISDAKLRHDAFLDAASVR